MSAQAATVTIDQIVASLTRRGFYGGISFDDTQTQVYAVNEELGEVSRMFRRSLQGVELIDPTRLREEAVDVLIAAVCLAATACGSRLSDAVAEKLEHDEARGWRHNGTQTR